MDGEGVMVLASRPFASGGKEAGFVGREKSGRGTRQGIFS